MNIVLLKKGGKYMALSNTYTVVNGQLPEFFQKIQDGQAPEKFTQQHLKDIGFTSTNHRAFIQILKSLGFLTPDGTPTQRYHEYRNRAICKKVMGAAIKEAYSDLFVIKERPTASDKDIIQGKFKSSFNATDLVAERQAKTFLALLELADLDAQATQTSESLYREHIPEPTPEVSTLPPVEIPNPQTMTSRSKSPSLHYNIEIHLPATKDIEVYNAIFKSIKEHLFD